MDKTMKEMRKRLSDTRTKCPGMSEEVYQLADYLAKHINEEIVPRGVVIILICTMDDINKGRCGFGGGDCSFPDYFIEHKSQVLAQACYILQIIDEVTDAEFANDVRTECKNTFHWNVPKRVSVSDDNEYPAYVTAAIDWWAEAIQHPKMDNGSNSLGSLMAMLGGSSLAKNFSEEEMKNFRSKLAAGIISEIEKYGCAQLRVDYGPDGILYEAGEAAGITNGFAFPCKTYMRVSKDEVTVSAGYAAPNETIWKYS
jgi:hypothetical protein